MHNNIFINRLKIVSLEGKVVYDEKFHKGVNIIRGKNSSGKSTITHFLFYVLGGAFNSWVLEAKKCDHVLAEIEINGATVTLKRNISENAKEPMYLFWGSMTELNTVDVISWEKYGYNRTKDKKSFSNILFDLLEVPIVYGENNISMHQILRLLYVDQNSPTSSLFYYEQFDTQLNRETVADVLLGVYNEELYKNKVELKECESKYDELKSELKGMRRFSTNALDLSTSHLKTKIVNLKKEVIDKETEIIALKAKQKAANYTKKSKLEFESLNTEAVAIRQEVKVLEEQVSLRQYEADDTEYFVTALETKLKAIKNSMITREFLGVFKLDHCPECLSVLDDRVDANTCKLCKGVIDKSYGVTQAKKIEKDLQFQIRESKKNIVTRKEQLSHLELKLNRKRSENIQIQRKVNQALKDVKSFRSEKVDQMYIDKGYLEGEILQFRTLLEVAESYELLIKEKNNVDQRIKLLRSSIKKSESKQVSQKSLINSRIRSYGLDLLKNDLHRQEQFKNAQEFNIDFRNNLAFLEDKGLRFSASSDFYLKNTARFSIFFASLEIGDMRYPRFILCDNMEDKGIEMERAQNFQKLLVQRAGNYDKNTYQMIFTTSMIPSELNLDEYTVGDYYTEEKRSLQF